VERVLAIPAIAATRRVLDRYGSTGGGLLAGGLAYAALFAIVPAMLLLVGVLGLVVDDPAEQERVIDAVVSVLPPLRELLTSVLSEAARGAAPVSLIGAVGLVWGASRFGVAFQAAIARVMGGERRQALVANLVAFGAVLLLVAAIIASSVVSGMVAFLELGAALGVIPLVGSAVRVTLSLLPIALILGATVLVYRLVPVPAPPWRAAVIPGIAAGFALTILGLLFAYLAPRLIGSAALLGTLATVFAALAWLSLSFQAILLGAAWVRDRVDHITPPGAKRLSP